MPSKLDKNSLKILDFVMNYHRKPNGTKGFTSSIIPCSTKMLPHSKGLAFTYKIPKELCSSSSNFRASAVLAVFDEVSTYCFMARDKTRRGGVSISLSTEILEQCSAEDDVKFVVNVNKIGRSVGFCSMELRGPDDTIRARGKHIKFMPMGALYGEI